MRSMDLGWATGRGRAIWATVLGIVAALAVIGGSLIALNNSVLSLNGWSSEPQPGIAEQTLPPAPEDAIDTGSTGGTAAPVIPGAAGVPLVPVLPGAGGGGGAAGTAGGTGGGTAGGTLGGAGGTGANGAVGGLDVSPPTTGAPGAGVAQPRVPGQVDTDGDGIPNAAERAAGTNPAAAD